MATVNGAGMYLIRLSEGLCLHAYDDGTGVWTIGYGHTEGVKPGDVCTVEQAERWLAAEVQKFSDAVQNRLERPANPNQFAAMVSLAYNVGVDGFPGLLADHNRGDFKAAQQHFMRYVWAGDKVLGGLVTRRQREAALYAKPVG